MSYQQHPDPDSVGPPTQPEAVPGHEPVALLDAPPERIGLLLAAARTRQGLSLSDVVARLDSPVDAAGLMAIESGALEVDPSVMEELVATYGVTPESLVPPRSALIIDLNEGYLRAGPDIALLTDGAGREAVLSRYLEMVWELRSVEPGSVVPLRGADLSMLAEQLGEDPEAIEAQLRRIMTKQAKRQRNTVLVGLAAAVLAVTGAVIAWQATSGDAPSTEPTTAVQEVTQTTVETEALPPAPTASVGDAEVLERDASEVPAAADLDALPPAPSAEIGDAATLERDAAEVPSPAPAPVPAPAPAPAPAPQSDLGSLPPAPSASVGDAAVVERNPDGTEGQQQTR